MPEPTRDNLSAITRHEACGCLQKRRTLDWLHHRSASLITSRAPDTLQSLCRLAPVTPEPSRDYLTSYAEREARERLQQRLTPRPSPTEVLAVETPAATVVLKAWVRNQLVARMPGLIAVLLETATTPIACMAPEASFSCFPVILRMMNVRW